jgi:hypothetical protein
VLNGYLISLLEDIFFHFKNLYAPAALLVHWSMLVFCMPLIFYLHVVVVVAFLFMLLQFACLGFCNRDWNNIVPRGVVVSFFFLHCMLLIVA